MRFRGASWLAIGVAAGAIFTALPAAADVRLPAVFSDHMVLQQDRTAVVWGWADEGERVRVSIAGQTKNARPNADGRWTVRLDAIEAAGPHTLTVSGDNIVTIDDVLVGEVWLCSGQSNMVFKVATCNDLEKEKAAATLPKMRYFTVATKASSEPLDDVEGRWVVISPETVEQCSGTAYFFGRALHEQLGVPVGLIVSAVGGTPVEAWTSSQAQSRVKALAPILDPWTELEASYDEAQAKVQYEKALAAWQEAAKKARDAGRQAPRRPRLTPHPDQDTHAPARLYNGMIAPLVGYTIRGGIWYQGESNAGKPTASLYRTQLPLMVRDWRRRWGQGEFPFAWVQLPNFRARVDDVVQTTGWTIVQEAMLESVEAVPNSGMAVAIDIGEADNIHPKNKQDVGARLAAWALSSVYGAKKGPPTGPLYAHHEIDAGQVTVGFHHAGEKLATSDGSAPRGFAIAGQNRKWYPASAEVRGKTVVLSNPEVRRPAAVRYAWAENPDCNLVGASGIPASPFRSDKWPE